MPLNAAHRVHMFQAYRVGHVTAMCRTPQGELWTGSSRGNVRWGRHPGAQVSPGHQARCRGLAAAGGAFCRPLLAPRQPSQACRLRLACPAACVCHAAQTCPPPPPPARRVWELGAPALLAEHPSPPRCRELRKGYGERAHGGPVLRLVCPADGQLVWSASPKGVMLWDAACGAFLGLLQRTAPRLGPAPSSGELLAGNGDREREALRHKVDGTKVRRAAPAATAYTGLLLLLCLLCLVMATDAVLMPTWPCSCAHPTCVWSLPHPALPLAVQGLETDPLTGYITARPPSSDWARWAADQETWAAQVGTWGPGRQAAAGLSPSASLLALR